MAIALKGKFNSNWSAFQNNENSIIVERNKQVVAIFNLDHKADNKEIGTYMYREMRKRDEGGLVKWE